MSICTSREQSCKSKLHLATQLFQVVLYKICTLHFETTPQQKDRVETATRKWKVQLESPNLHLKKCQEVAPQGAGKLHLRNRKTTPQGAGKLHLREGQKSTSQGSGLSLGDSLAQSSSNHHGVVFSLTNRKLANCQIADSSKLTACQDWPTGSCTWWEHLQQNWLHAQPPPSFQKLLTQGAWSPHPCSSRNRLGYQALWLDTQPTPGTYGVWASASKPWPASSLMLPWTRQHRQCKKPGKLQLPHQHQTQEGSTACRSPWVCWYHQCIQSNQCIQYNQCN